MPCFVVAAAPELLVKRQHTERTVALDSAIVQQQVSHHRDCLTIALQNYKRAITAGDQHDLQVLTLAGFACHCDVEWKGKSSFRQQTCWMLGASCSRA